MKKRNYLVTLLTRMDGYEDVSYHLFRDSDLARNKAVKLAIENEARCELDWEGDDYDEAYDCSGELYYCLKSIATLSDSDAKVIERCIDC